MNNNLRNSEKFLKSCWKKKVTITLGTVIVFLMTGCGSSGGGSSSSSTSSRPVVDVSVAKPGDLVYDKGNTEIEKTENGFEIINGNYKGVQITENAANQPVFTQITNEANCQYTKIGDNQYKLVAKLGGTKIAGLQAAKIEATVDGNKKLIGDKTVKITTTDGKTIVLQQTNNENEFKVIEGTTVAKLNGLTIKVNKDKTYTYITANGDEYNKTEGGYTVTRELKNGSKVTWSIKGDNPKEYNEKFVIIDKDGSKVELNYVPGANVEQGQKMFDVISGGLLNGINHIIYHKDTKNFTVLDGTAAVTLRDAGVDSNGNTLYDVVHVQVTHGQDRGYSKLKQIIVSKDGKVEIVDTDGNKHSINIGDKLPPAGEVTPPTKPTTPPTAGGDEVKPQPPVDVPGQPTTPSQPSEPAKPGDTDNPSTGDGVEPQPPVVTPDKAPVGTVVKDYADKGIQIKKEGNNEYKMYSDNKNYKGVNITVADSGEIKFNKNNSITDITYTINKDTLEKAKKGQTLEFGVNVVFDNTNTKSDDRKKLANGMIVDSVDATVSTSNILVDGSSSVNLKPVGNITANINGGKKLVFSDITSNGATIGNGNGASVKLTKDSLGQSYTMSGATGSFKELNGATISKKDKNLVITQDGTDYTVGNGVYTGEKVLEAANGNKATWTYDANGKIQNNGEFTITDKSNKTFKLAKIENNEFSISGISNVSKVTYDSSNSTFTLFDSIDPSSSVTLKVDTKNTLEGKIAYEVTEQVGSNKLISDAVKYIIVDIKTGDFQLVSKLPSSSSNNGYTEIAKNTYAKKVEGLKSDNVYMINKNGKNYIYNGELSLAKSVQNQASTYVDLSAIQNAINVEQGTTNVTTIVNAIKTKNIQGIKYPVQSETNSNGQIAQKVDNSSDKNTQQLGNLVNINKLEINGTNISNTQQPASKEKANYAIGQMLKETGGVNAFNFGVIDVKSTNDVAIGQVSYSNMLSHMNGMGLYNLGLIKVQANGAKSIITTKENGREYTINGAGIYVQSIETPVFGYNLGTIAIDNTKNNGAYKSVGMVADGKGARVYNFGTIEVTGSATEVVNGNLNIAHDNTFLMGVNGGQAFNYGTLKANNTNLEVSGTVNSSTTAKYVSDKKVVIGDTLNVLAEAGKGDSYTVEGYITAKEGVEGLDKVTSNGVYSVSTVENTDKDGNKVVDLQLNKTKKLEQTATGDTAQMISNLGLDQYIYSTNKGKYAGALQGMISANGGNADVLKPLFGFEYANLNGVILNSARDFMDNTNAVIANKGAYVSGDFNRNFEGMATFDKTGTKVGVFKKYREKANENAGMDYTRDSIAVVANQKITDNFSLNLGYENEKDKYEGDSKLESNRGMLGFNFNYDFGQGISYNLLANGTYGKSQMTRNGVKDGKFNTYTVGMENSITKAFEVEYLNESAVTLGIRTIGFGHDKIDLKNSIDAPESVKKNFNVSNAAVVKVKAGKSFEITEKHKLNITTEVKYEKELMNTDDWKDNLKFDTLSGDFVGAPVADDKAGKVSAKVQVGVEVADGYSVGAYFKADTLGYREGGVQVTYKF